MNSLIFVTHIHTHTILNTQIKSSQSIQCDWYEHIFRADHLVLEKPSVCSSLEKPFYPARQSSAVNSKCEFCDYYLINSHSHTALQHIGM